jgi:hypothetical protein
VCVMDRDRVFKGMWSSSSSDRSRGSMIVPYRVGDSDILNFARG